MKIYFTKWKICIYHMEIDLRALFINRWTMLIIFLVLATVFGVLKAKIKSDFHDLYYILAVIALIYNAIIAAYDSQQLKKLKQLEQSTILINRFDSKDLRFVRDFTRALRNEKKRISDDEFKKDLSDVNKKEIIKILKSQGYKTNNIKNINIERELVFLFNYWQGVYLSIKNGLCDKKSILHALGAVYKAQYERFSMWIGDNIKANDQQQYDDLKKFKEIVDNECE